MFYCHCYYCLVYYFVIISNTCLLIFTKMCTLKCFNIKSTLYVNNLINIFIKTFVFILV